MGNILHKSSERPGVLVHVAENVRRLRRGAGLSQQALADRARVSRRTLVGVEKGDVNISLNVLDRIADAVGVFFHTLVQPAGNADSARIDELAWVGERVGSYARLLASTPARQAVELWSWSLAPGQRYDSPADGAGWREMLAVVAGALTLRLKAQTITITAGDFYVFASDQPHGYANETALPVEFLRNVVY